MKVFFGAALQGARDRSERAGFNAALISAIRDGGHEVVTEHTTGRTKEEAASLLEESIGPLPPPGLERTRYVRERMIGLVEGSISAAVFEVSIPSLGTGIELAHAYLRPRMGLPEVPVLAIYQRGYWPNNLSSMVRGIDSEKMSHFTLEEYGGLEDARRVIGWFLAEKI
ncbi:MAG: hypothetical protein GF416_06810 [Candidatus Altiarchaeales archaeon]|nr:hypothetical protein [Candidatus Altiarchaeales archaeon]MBD3416823.1 hypothetical protein [Candidatus Altiarchaeales archaeon]